MFAMPFTFGVYLSDTSTASLTYFIIPAVAGTIYLGPCLAMVQALVPLRMRTVASAILLFIINIIGLGLGPQMVGVVSDLLTDRFAIESMRYALFFTGFVNVWSAFHFYMAARNLKAELAEAKGTPVIGYWRCRRWSCRRRRHRDGTRTRPGSHWRKCDDGHVPMPGLRPRFLRRLGVGTRCAHLCGVIVSIATARAALPSGALGVSARKFDAAC